ncbi:MAG: IS5 family transposase [Oligoflexales bacterium]|nr:IS5 family transposase [Oligoflexales bacterium]
MRPKDLPKQRDLFKVSLSPILDLNHPLVVLSKKIDWLRFEAKFGDMFCQNNGRPGVPTRIVIGLLYIKHTFNLSDEEVLKRFAENPYWQYFCGCIHFENKAPCDKTVLVRWRQRMGEEGMEALLQETLAVAVKEKYLPIKDLDEVNIDTSVQEKNITFPTDAKLLNRARESLVRDAKKNGINLRQTYESEGKLKLIKYSRYCHAKQFKRAKKPLRRLKTILGRVIRDIERKCAAPDEKLQNKLILARRIWKQQKESKGKIYSIHEPGVECISKGKAHKRYEFGCKVSIVTTNRSNWVIGSKALHGRPYDGHTFNGAMDQVKKIVGKFPAVAYADKGYRGATLPEGTRLFLSGQKRGVDAQRRKKLNRRSAIEPVIGHLKSGHRLSRNFLKGIDGDKNNTILAGIGFNMAKLIAAIFLPNFISHFLQNFV